MRKIKFILPCMFTILVTVAQTLPANAQENMHMKAAQELEKETFDVDSYYHSFGYVAVMRLRKEMNKNPATAKYERPLMQILIEAVEETFFDKEILTKIERIRTEVLFEEFNEIELKELLAFAKTPVGKKYIAKQADVVHKTENKMMSELDSFFSNRLNEKFNIKIKKLIKNGIISKESNIELE
ncbi:MULTISPECIES: DUF2059 domain-containing protein [unclassified Maridesulfovibrio]|uniref:DUF2059 domain-containing protein n=1 Tax=unclassified Maridesulfovibrio TaxID=2794999 RepID=UPI003B3C190A